MTQDITLRRNAAYGKLRITDRTLIRKLPPISSQLRMIASRLRKRKLPASPYYYLKCASDSRAAQIVDLYYSLPKNQRDLVPIEAYCLSIGADSDAILDLIARTIARVTRQTSTILASASHPLVVEKTVEMALTDEGIEDRMTLHKAVGFLPTPKGSQTNISVQTNSSASAAAPVAILAPPPEHTIRKLADRFNDARTVTVTPTLPAADESSTIPDRMPYEDSVAVEAELDDDDS